MNRASFHIKARPELRSRVEVCAKLIGATVPEFVREAIRDKCELVERTNDRRQRAAAAADDADRGGP